MHRPLLALGIIHLLASLCVAAPGEIRPLPPGWVYPALPVAYEGKTLSELGPIKSIEVVDREHPALPRHSPVPNELIRKLVFELRLAHPATYAMLDKEYAKIIEVTFVDGTRFRSYGTVGQYIFAPNQPRVTCLLLPEENYRRDRIPVPATSKLDPAGTGQPATKPADKGPEPVQPSPPTPKDAPRLPDGPETLPEK